MPFVLASASPRRAELLRAAGFTFTVDPVDVDESLRPGEDPATHVRRLAREKASAGARRHPGSAVLGADTVVVLDGQIMGKPSGDQEARGMLAALSGRVHQVYTGVAVARDQAIRDEVDVSAVTFGRLSDQDIATYVASGEPRDKAGAYAIQGWASRYVDRLEGSYSGVVGLPIAVAHRLLLS
jgi:septum formation protein